ncbi:DUF3658 domain-containing protein [Burkholderia gladioli]|uniref:DUF3658 domain-containing protein n=1 Tax=Burkholderia gladioli TaxID=28095 RepID=UPI0016408589|nr:DUF3658 domain-containing protein [Burkholderia gladioli]
MTAIVDNLTKSGPAGKVVHVTFNSVVAAHVASFGGNVLLFPDNLSIGPIWGTQEERAQWLLSFFGEIPPSQVELGVFFQSISEPDITIIFWCDASSVIEYSNFLGCIAHNEFGEAYIVRPGKLRQKEVDVELAFQNLFNDRERLSEETLADLRGKWEKLKSGQGVFRVFSSDGSLVSVGCDIYDQIILSKMRDNWERVSSIVVHTISDPVVRALGRGLTDLVIAARIKNFVRRGLVECQFDIEESVLGNSIRRVKESI